MGTIASDLYRWSRYRSRGRRCGRDVEPFGLTQPSVICTPSSTTTNRMMIIRIGIVILVVVIAIICLITITRIHVMIWTIRSLTLVSGGRLDNNPNVCHGRIFMVSLFIGYRLPPHRQDGNVTIIIIISVVAAAPLVPINNESGMVAANTVDRGRFGHHIREYGVGIIDLVKRAWDGPFLKIRG